MQLIQLAPPAPAPVLARLLAGNGIFFIAKELGTVLEPQPGTHQCAQTRGKLLGDDAAGAYCRKVGASGAGGLAAGGRAGQA